MACCGGPKCCSNFDDDREGISDADVARFGGDGIECPECGAEMYHDAALCSACGYAVSEARRGNRSAKPLLFVGVIVALAIAAFVAFRF